MTPPREIASPTRLRPLSVVPYLPYLLLVVVHAVLGWPMRHPIVFADELGYLGQARFLSGSGLMPDMGTATYYHFGYSLFLLPAFWLFDHPTAVYRAAILINAGLISLLYFGVLALLQSPLRQPNETAVPVAFVTCLYPAFMLQSNLAWAENALIPAYAFLVVALSATVSRYSWRRVLTLGLLAGFLFAVHPRALPLLPLTAITLGALAAARVIPLRGLLVGAGAIGLVYVVTDGTADWLRNIGWSAQRDPVSVGRFLARRASAERLVATIVVAAGQLLSLVQATCGLIVVPALWLAHRWWREGARRMLEAEERPAVITVAFVLLSSLVLFGVSALATSGSKRADGMVYERYNEAFLPYHLAFSLTLLTVARERIPVWRLGSAVVLILGLLTAILLAGRGSTLDAPYVAPNMLGIYPLVRAIGSIDPVRISAFSGCVAVIIFAAFRRRSRWGLAAAATWFFAGSLYAYPYFHAAQRFAATVDDIPSRVRALRVGALGYDVRLFERSSSPYYSTQYLLPRTRVRRFSVDRGEPPAAPVVMSTTGWPEAEAHRARFVTSQRGADLALWILPSAKGYYSASFRYLGVAIGWRRFPGVWESGFHGREQNSAGPFRWTDGNARLVVPVNQFPTHLVTDLRPASAGMRVLITVNRAAIHDGTYARGRKSFELSGITVSDWVTVEVKSDTRRPKADTRRIGVAVREIRLDHR